MAVLGSSYGIDCPRKLPQIDGIASDSFSFFYVERTIGSPALVVLPTIEHLVEPLLVNSFDENSDVIHPDR